MHVVPLSVIGPRNKLAESALPGAPQVDERPSRLGWVRRAFARR
jgi:hypothetical protein